MKSDSGWQWVKRPRWAILLVAIGFFVGWWLWPITLYETVGRWRGYKITLPDSSETAGGSIMVMPYQTDLWSERKRLARLKESSSMAEPVLELGDSGYWIRKATSSPSVEPDLLWHRGNVTFLLVARKLEGHERGTLEWKAACERIAFRTDAEFLEGRAGSYDVRIHRIPRVYVLARSAWDRWLRHEGIREPLPWWRNSRP